MKQPWISLMVKKRAYVFFKCALALVIGIAVTNKAMAAGHALGGASYPNSEALGEASYKAQPLVDWTDGYPASGDNNLNEQSYYNPDAEIVNEASDLALGYVDINWVSTVKRKDTLGSFFIRVQQMFLYHLRSMAPVYFHEIKQSSTGSTLKALEAYIS